MRKALLIALLALLTAGCSSVGLGETPVQSWLETGAPVIEQEKTVARTFVQVFAAYNEKDYEKLAALDPRATKDMEHHFDQLVGKTRDYKLHLVEVSAYSDTAVRGRVVYSWETTDRTYLGKTRFYSWMNCRLEKKSGRWLLADSSTFRTTSNVTRELQEIFIAMMKAEKRYGTDNLAYWQQLN